MFYFTPSLLGTPVPLRVNNSYYVGFKNILQGHSLNYLHMMYMFVNVIFGNIFTHEMYLNNVDGCCGC